MAIIQVNFWHCESCDKVYSTQEETSPYSDPVVYLPTDEVWDYIEKDGEEILICPDCIVKDHV